MYESFFGIEEKPFSLTPDPRYFYLSESHREALSALIYGVRERVGLITLTGPVGVGKTMILASFLDQAKEHAETACFSGEIARNRTEFLRDLCSLLGISPEQETLFGTSQAIKDFAIREAGEGRSVVVLVDEAQDLGPQELEHFHHLCNLETPEAKLLQIVLAGTEKLDEKLKDERLEALWQRVAIRCAIKPIEPEETIAYIFHRVGVAGRASTGLFTDDALWRIVNFSRGVPRQINLVCNQAMISAYSSGRCPVDEGAVMEALKEIEGGRTVPEAEGIVEREAIGRLIEAASQRQEEGPFLSEGGGYPVTKERQGADRKVEVAAEDGGSIHRRRHRRFFYWFRPGRKLALALVLILLIALAGLVMNIDLPRDREGVVERVGVSLSEKSGTGRAADLPEGHDPGYETPRGGPEEAVREQGIAVNPSGLLPLRRSEDEGIAVGSGRSPDRSEEESWARMDSKHGVPAGAEKKQIREKDVAGIALERYGRLDVEILRVLREKNPQVRDWNNLTENVPLVLPDVSPATNGGADFYTIQVGAFREEQGASRRISDLEKKGAQNLFLVRGGEDRKLTFVCVGVFESGQGSLGALRKMKEWGFDDAFPTRIEGKRLEDILQP